MKIFSFRVLVLLHGNGNDSNRINKNNKNNECWTIWRNVSLNCNLSNFLPIKTYYNTTYLRSIEVARFISTISIFLSFPFVHCIFSVRYSSFCRFSTLWDGDAHVHPNSDSHSSDIIPRFQRMYIANNGVTDFVSLYFSASFLFLSLSLTLYIFLPLLLHELVGCGLSSNTSVYSKLFACRLLSLLDMQR